MALHRRSTSLPCDSRRPLLQHSESDMSSVLQTRAPPEDRLPIFTGRKAWETWVNSSPSMRARIEEQDGHDINENDGFGTKYPEFGESAIFHEFLFLQHLTTARLLVSFANS